jgi:hypothetical protein
MPMPTRSKFDAAVVRELHNRWSSGTWIQGTLGAWFLRFFGARPWFIQFTYAAEIYGETDGIPEQVKAWQDGAVLPIGNCGTCPFLDPNGACRICSFGKGGHHA